MVTENGKEIVSSWGDMKKVTDQTAEKMKDKEAIFVKNCAQCWTHRMFVLTLILYLSYCFCVFKMDEIK